MTEELMPIPTMYTEVFRLKTAGIQGYDFEKKYEDPTKIIKERRAQSARHAKPSKVPSKASYLDELQRESKKLPAPGQYSYPDAWPKKCRTIKSAGSKKTYLDEVISKSKRQKFPAPGQYNCQKTLKQLDAQREKMKNKKPPHGERINYLDEVTYSSSMTPGPGMYNLSASRRKVTENKTKPEDWRRKSEQQAKRKPPKTPDMGTYNPTPIDYTIFDNLKKSKAIKHSDWSKQVRFDIPVPGVQSKKEETKTKSRSNNVPGPGHYQMIHRWSGKDDGRRKSRDYFEAMAKPPSRSVYYN